MLGNVLEWTGDYWGSDAHSNQQNLVGRIFSLGRQPDVVVDPHGPPAGSRRVIRGGHWDCSDAGVRSAYRNVVGPSYRSGVSRLPPREVCSTDSLNHLTSDLSLS